MNNNKNKKNTPPLEGGKGNPVTSGRQAMPPTNQEYIGKVPPQSRELEASVIGGVMLDNKLYDKVAVILKKPEYFYATANQDIWRIITKLRDKGIPVDLVTITEELRSAGQLEQAGGPYYLANLSNAFSSQESIVFAAEKIKECWVKRDLILATFSLNDRCYDPTEDVESLVNTLQEEGIAMAAELHKSADVSLKDTFIEMVEDAEYRNNLPEDERMSGIPSSIKEFNEMTGGYQRQELTIKAGRPSHGKTAASLGEAIMQAELGYKVGYFSIEMSQREIMQRVASWDEEIDMIKFKVGGLTQKDFEKMKRTAMKMQRLAGNLFFDYRNPLTINEIKAKCREWKQKSGLDIVYVDHIGLTDGDKNSRYRGNDSRNEELGYITRGLKQIAKELDIAVVALSQMSRKIEDRPINARWPQLSDLRDSGNIEQDADLVVFIIRPEIWYKDVNNDKYTEWKGLGVWDIAKQRNGPIGHVRTVFRGAFGKFVNFSKEYEAPAAQQKSAEPF